jgi:hypothetical protein
MTFPNTAHLSALVMAGVPGWRATRCVEPCHMNHVERMQQRFEVPVIIAALLVIPAMALVRADPQLMTWWAGVVLNTVIWLVFVAELVRSSLSHRWRWTRDGAGCLPLFRM